MAGDKKRSISTAFWTDPFIEDLSTEEKLLFLYLITNEKTNMLGAYEVSLRKMSYDTGLTRQKIETYLKGFETLKKIIYQKNYVVLLNFFKHQNFNKNMMISAVRDYNDLPVFLKIHGVNELDDEKETINEGFETLCNGFGRVRKKEREKEEEREEEKEGEAETKKDEPIDFKEVIYVFHSVCLQQPKVISINDKRKKLIQARAKDFSLEKIGDVFKKVSNSDFLNSKKSFGFDWIMNPANFIKILEGNYDNNETPQKEKIVAGRQTAETIKQNLDPNGWGDF